jgi:putative transposase
VDTLGLLLVVLVTAASADDGTTAPQVLGRLTAEHCRRLEKLWADQKYRNRKLQRWQQQEQVSYVIEVVSRPLGAKGFVLLHRRWVVERTLAWLGRYRALSKDSTYYTRSSEAQVQVSSVQLMLRRLRPNKDKPCPPFKHPKKTA